MELRGNRRHLAVLSERHLGARNKQFLRSITATLYEISSKFSHIIFFNKKRMLRGNFECVVENLHVAYVLYNIVFNSFIFMKNDTFFSFALL